jgi:hypothetical protein
MKRDGIVDEYATNLIRRGKYAFTIKEIKDLQQKGYLLNSSESDLKFIETEWGEVEGVKEIPHAYTDKLEVTDDFCKQLFVEGKFAGEELFEVYPHFLSQKINGVRVHAKKGMLVGNEYWGKDELINIYGQRIKNDLQLHKKILESVRYADSIGQVTVTLREFIVNELWFGFFKLRDDTDNMMI